MKYNHIRIDPYQGKWEVAFVKDDADRQETKTLPNAQGFYHYPETMDRNVALKELLDCMSQRHIYEISKLRQSLEALEQVYALHGLTPACPVSTNK